MTSTSNGLSTTTAAPTTTTSTIGSNSISHSINNSLYNHDVNLKLEETESNKSSSKSTSPMRPSDLNSDGALNEFDNSDALWNSLEKNATHSDSPGFLRGRGRGRPKLIGDELDAELVEYMVQVNKLFIMLNL